MDTTSSLWYHANVLRLETNDLSRAKEIILHPEIIAETGVLDDGQVYVTGPDRTIILLMDDDTPVGYIGFWHKNNAVAEMGVGVLSEYRGQAVKVACQAAITAMFYFGFQTITCRVKKNNIPSMTGARILGFRKQHEGPDGVKFAMTRDKWFTLHPQARQ